MHLKTPLFPVISLVTAAILVISCSGTSGDSDTDNSTVSTVSSDITIKNDGTTYTAVPPPYTTGTYAWYFNEQSTVVSATDVCTVGNGSSFNVDTTKLSRGYYELAVIYTVSDKAVYSAVCQVPVSK